MKSDVPILPGMNLGFVDPLGRYLASDGSELMSGPPQATSDEIEVSWQVKAGHGRSRLSRWSRLSWLSRRQGWERMIPVWNGAVYPPTRGFEGVMSTRAVYRQIWGGSSTWIFLPTIIRDLFDCTADKGTAPQRTWELFDFISQDGLKQCTGKKEAARIEHGSMINSGTRWSE